jgi:hypothetical protein
VLGVVAPYLPRGLRLLAGVAAALCLVVVIPGVVSQSDLDAKWINAVPALTWTWLAVLLATPAVWLLWFRQPKPAPATAEAAGPSPAERAKPA